MIDWLPNFNQSNIVVALRAALAAAAILYVLEIYDIKNGMGHLGFLAVVLSCFARWMWRYASLKALLALRRRSKDHTSSYKRRPRKAQPTAPRDF